MSIPNSLAILPLDSSVLVTIWSFSKSFIFYSLSLYLTFYSLSLLFLKQRQKHRLKRTSFLLASYLSLSPSPETVAAAVACSGAAAAAVPCPGAIAAAAAAAAAAQGLCWEACKTP